MTAATTRMTAHTTDGSDWTDSDDHVDGDDEVTGEDAYNAVCRCIHYNTGGPDTPMRAGVRVSSFMTTLVAHANHDRRQVRQALSQAESNGDVVLWEDRDDRLRATLTDAKGVRDLVAEENRRDDTTVELIERATAARSEGVFAWPDNYGRSVDGVGGGRT